MRGNVAKAPRCLEDRVAFARRGLVVCETRNVADGVTRAGVGNHLEGREPHLFQLLDRVQKREAREARGARAETVLRGWRTRRVPQRGHGESG